MKKIWRECMKDGHHGSERDGTRHMTLHQALYLSLAIDEPQAKAECQAPSAQHGLEQILPCIECSSEQMPPSTVYIETRR